MSVKKPKACFVYYMKFDNSAILYREAKAMAEKGYDVDIVCLRNEPSEPVFQEFDGLKLYRIQARPNSEQHLALYFIRLCLFLVKTFFFISWLGIRNRYRIIHVTSPPDVMVFTTLVPKLLGAKVILDIHDIGPEFSMRKLEFLESHPFIRLLRFLERISARYSDHVITVTNLWKETLGSRSCPPDKVSVLLNVPDERLFFSDRVKARESSEGLNLFYHGSLEEHFGVDTLMMAMPTIVRALPNVALHIYGQGRLRDELERMSGELGLGGEVIIHPHVPFFELPEILSRDADVGIVPTKGAVFSGEALSMKSLEYISLGIPIVITHTKAHSYYYDDSMVEFFEAEDSDALAKAVIGLVRDSGKRRRHAEKALEFLRKYGWGEGRKAYYGIIDRLVGV